MTFGLFVLVLRSSHAAAAIVVTVLRCAIE
jgi:hypothetical protein